MWELLPWYHNDGLVRPSVRGAGTAIFASAVCTRELKPSRQLDMALTPRRPWENASAQGFQRLTAERCAPAVVAATPASAVERGPGAGAAPLAAVAVAAFGLMLVWNVERGSATAADSVEKQFQTLGRHDGSAPPSTAPLLRVVLKESVDAAARQARSTSHDAELVDGPSDIGVMTVRVQLARNVSDVIDAMRVETDTSSSNPCAIRARDRIAGGAT